jgi:hypothetical protein
LYPEAPATAGESALQSADKPGAQTADDEPAYAPPAIAWEEWLDVKATLVMACAKVNPLAGPPCDQGVAMS